MTCYPVSLNLNTIVRVNVHRAAEKGVRKEVGPRVNEGTELEAYTRCVVDEQGSSKPTGSGLATADGHSLSSYTGTCTTVGNSCHNDAP